ncbi:Glycosyl transferase group 1 [archaeon GW2011_AR15]|nr:Glycosyl transferase group 1 [archaeon GW2011_AR15]MBS3103574.1 glycosyltransferase [Candidatus Woesearchaeota archaeon]
MKVLMLGTYNIKGYSRGRILYKGLQKNNADVDIYLCRKWTKYFDIARRVLRNDYDIIIATGKFVLLVSKLLKAFHRKPIVFDAFISDYDNLVNDRKTVEKNSGKAWMLWKGDKYACLLSDLVLLDTNNHINYFVEEFGLKRNKFRRVFIGADEEIFYPRKAHKSKEFVVSFHGTFIPLQGIEYIVKAAKILEKEKIKFEIVGAGQTYNEIKELCKKLKIKNIDFLGFKKLETLPGYISRGDVCLGIFGASEKTQRVIPNKAYEIIAMEKPLITGDTPAIKELFSHKKNCYLCNAADERSLADAIMALKKDAGLRKKIASGGNALFEEKCSAVEMGKTLKQYLAGLQ